MKSSVKLRYFLANLAIFSLSIILCHDNAIEENLNNFNEENIYSIEEQKEINLLFLFFSLY